MSPSKIINVAIVTAVVATLLVCAGLISYHQQMEQAPQPDKYTKTIDRQYRNETELGLISQAEAISPPDGNWQCRTADNIKVLDTLNIDAVNYYSALIDNIRNNPGYTGITTNSAHFRYSAKVEYFSNFGEYNTTAHDLIKVSLTMEFSAACGNVCGVGFHHYRTVVFDMDHRPVSVMEMTR